MNLLVPHGQFGSRLGGGAKNTVGGDAASPRYLFTYASPVARLLFRPEDDALLERLQEEGQEVEPRVYWPVLPVLLLNGSDAIGTGFSTSVPGFRPSEVAANVRRALAGESLVPMTPWFGKGFKGTVTAAGPGKWTVAGVVTPAPSGAPDEWVVSELPLDVAFTKYADWLGEEGAPAELLANRCTDVSANFLVKLKQSSQEPPLKALKLLQTVACTNMWCFDATGAIKKYASAEEILTEWVPWRLARYAERRDHMLGALRVRAAELESRARFVRAVISGDISLTKTGTRAALLERLRAASYAAPEKLVLIPANSFCPDAAEDATRAAAAARAEAAALEAKTPRDLWEADLDALAEVLA